MPTHPNLKSAGAAASLIFYERFRGLYSNPIKGKIKPGAFEKTIDSFSGRTSRMAKQACVAMSQASQLMINKEMIQRLSSAFQHWFSTNSTQQNDPLNHVPGISGFRFNGETSLNQKLEINFETEWKSMDKMLLKIPAINPRQDIIAPARTLTIQLKLASACISINPSRSTHFIKNLPFSTKGNLSTQVTIPFTKDIIPAKEIEIPVSQQPGSISLLIGSLEYIILQKGKLTTVTDKKWLPVDILSAVYVK